MRDLYERLGIGFAAETKNIEQAIARCKDSETVKAATEVLLKTHRRRAYDRAYLAARHCSNLRQAINLESAPWALEHSSDFHGQVAQQSSVKNLTANESVSKSATAKTEDSVADKEKIWSRWFTKKN